jgi:hypothetical protein
VSDVYWRVDRLRRDGEWRQSSPESMGGFERNYELFMLTKKLMKRGRIRLVSNHGETREEHTA